FLFRSASIAGSPWARRIFYAAKLWRALTGLKEEDVVLRLFCRILSGVGEWVQAAALENCLKLADEFVVDQAIRSQRLPAIELERPAAEIAHRSSSLFHNQHTCSSIPGIQIELPKSVHASTRHIAQVQSRRSRSPHAVSAQRNLVIEVDVGILVALVAGEA